MQSARLVNSKQWQLHKAVLPPYFLTLTCRGSAGMTPPLTIPAGLLSYAMLQTFTSEYLPGGPTVHPQHISPLIPALLERWSAQPHDMHPKQQAIKHHAVTHSHRVHSTRVSQHSRVPHLSCRTFPKGSTFYTARKCCCSDHGDLLLQGVLWRINQLLCWCHHSLQLLIIVVESILWKRPHACQVSALAAELATTFALCTSGTIL